MSAVNPLDASATSGERAVLGVSLAILALALVALAGWLAGWPVLVNPVDGLIPVPYNTTLSFLALGTAGVGLALGLRWMQFGGAVVAALMGADALTQFAIGPGSAFDRLFFVPRAVIPAEPGAMELSTALNFLFTGGALAFAAVRPRIQSVLGVASSLTLSLALTSFVGYLFQLSYILPIKLGTPMALYPSAAFLGLGITLLNHAWMQAPRGPDGLPKWGPAMGLSLLPVLYVGADAFLPGQSWQTFLAEGLFAISGVALVTIAILKMATAKVAHKGLLMISSPLVLLLIFVALAVRVQSRNESTQIMALHSTNVIDASQALLTQIAESESAVRGFVITRDEQFATAYTGAMALAMQSARRMLALVEDNPVQSASALKIRDMLAQRSVRFAEVLGLARRGSWSPASSNVQNERGPALMTQLRAETLAFAQEEARLGSRRQQTLDESWQRLSWLLVSGTSAAIILAALLTVSFSGGIGRRLRLLRNNASNLAAGKALRPPLGGNDEIADLDQVFHEMAASLEQAALRERATRILEGHSTDIRHTEILLKTGALQRAIFNSANFSSIATDERGVIQIFNVGAERMLGYGAAEVMNQITPADISEPMEVIARAQALTLELGTPITPGFEALVFKASRGIEDIYELTYIRKDGTRFPAIVSVTALRDAQEAIIGYLLIGTDNTARKQVEAARALLDQRLRDQQFYTRSLIESNIDALMTTDPQGIISDVNQQMVALTGRTRDELIGAPSKNFFTDPDLAEAAITRVLTQGKVRNYELTVRALSGEETVVSYNAATFHDRDRKLMGVFAAARDVTERKRFERTLQEKNIELEHASRMKSEFLATMSHELRTPLNAIIGFSEALKDGLIGPTSPVQQEYIGDIFTSGEHLLSLINDILDLSKVEAGMMALELEPVDVKSLLTNGLSIVKEKTGTQRLDVSMTIDDSLDRPLLDLRKTRQIIYNLLSNAVKFSAHGGRITVTAQRVPLGSVGTFRSNWPQHNFPLADSGFREFLEICVSDTGIGISRPDMARLFKAFVQIDSSLARKFEGTGLGLAMVKQLAVLHGGTVAVTSAEGEGACFAVWLPLRWPDGVSTPLRPHLTPATAMLKQSPATADIPVIALTAMAMKEDCERTRAAGGDACIAKPLRYQAPYDAINALPPPQLPTPP